MLIACALFASGAHAEYLFFGNLSLAIDGGFTPRTLPRDSYSPIGFKGFINMKPVGGSVPPALQRAVIEFDRDGRLGTRGLATCDPSLLEESTPQEAREGCPRAIVGTGHIGALIATEGGSPVYASSLLTIFNGPPLEGDPTAIFHARTTVPGTQNFVITVPIERRAGAFRYRATVEIPPIAAGRGSLTHLDVNIDRRYRFQGSKRSYISARCRHNVLSTHGQFTFVEGIFLSGSVEKACTPR
ncbi:MAG: hypothetical protein ACJ75S_12055 [Solirubrobacterales bacterium]